MSAFPHPWGRGKDVSGRRTIKINPNKPPDTSRTNCQTNLKLTRIHTIRKRFKVRVHDHAYKDWGIFEPNRPLEGLNMGMYCSKNKFQASEKSTSSTTGKSYKRDQGKIAFEPISPGLRPVCLLKMVPAGPW